MTIKISVCIPTYNYGRFIGEALVSLQAQSFQDFEVIVSDNASTDETQDVVAEARRLDARIRYVRNDINVGMVANWNRCLALAQGEYVKILCADDLLQPRCLELLSQMLDENENVVLVSCARRVVASEVGTPGVLTFSRNVERQTGLAVINHCLARGNEIGEPTATMFKRQAAQRGFNADYSHLTDLEMWLYLLERGDFAFTPEILCALRCHPEQETRRNIRSRLAVREEIRLYDSYRQRSDLPLDIYARINGGVRLFPSRIRLLVGKLLEGKSVRGN